MKYWLLFLGILFTSSVFAECKVDQQKFGVSPGTIEGKVTSSKTLEIIPNVRKQIITVFEDVCPGLEEALIQTTGLNYHFIKDQLVAIQLERLGYDDFLLFEWGRKHFGIVEDRKINELQKLLEVEKNNRLIQVFIGNQDAAVYQSVLIISREHDDLFELLSKKQDEIDWENFEVPEEDPSEEEN